MSNIGLEEGRGNVSKAIIWDQEDVPSSNNFINVLWRGFGGDDKKNTISIPKLVEDNADSLKSNYLSFIFELGEMRIKGRRVIDCLQLREHFSYWWMTLFSQKCNFAKSTQIDDVIRLMAFEDWIASRSIDHIVLVTCNPVLAECVCILCKKLDISFEWRKIASKRNYVSWTRRLYQAAPHFLQALIWLLFHSLDRWALRGVGLKGWGR